MIGLVLSGGGARSAYQVGVLQFVAERLPDFRFPILTGVSAGAINATFLAAHRGTFLEATRELRTAWGGLSSDRVFHLHLGPLTAAGIRWIAAGSPGRKTMRSLVDTSPLRRFLHETIRLEGIDSNIAAGRLRALGLSSMSYSTGETITFVHAAAGIPPWERAMRRGVLERITVDHVMASSALPLIFPAVRVGDQYFGDGAVRQGAPLAPAIHLGADRILAIANRYPHPWENGQNGAVPLPAQIIGHLFHSVFLDSLDADAERLETVNRLLARDSSAPADLRPIRFLVVRPSQDVGKLAVAYREMLPRPMRMLLRSLGAYRARDANFLSYLIFAEPFLTRLMDLGYDDARQQWPEIEKFLAAD